MELPSLTENLRPSSLIVTCALFEKVMQRRSRNSWRAELETAVSTGGSSSSMSARLWLCLWSRKMRAGDGVKEEVDVVVIGLEVLLDSHRLCTQYAPERRTWKEN
jgi:hypothetical protein